MYLPVLRNSYTDSINARVRSMKNPGKNSKNCTAPLLDAETSILTSLFRRKPAVARDSTPLANEANHRVSDDTLLAVVPVAFRGAARRSLLDVMAQAQVTNVARGVLHQNVSEEHPTTTTSSPLDACPTERRGSASGFPPAAMPSWHGTRPHPNQSSAVPDPLARSLAHLLPGARKVSPSTPEGLVVEDSLSISDFDEETTSRPPSPEPQWRLLPCVPPAEEKGRSPLTAAVLPTLEPSQRTPETNSDPGKRSLLDVLQGMTPQAHLPTGKETPANAVAPRKSFKRGLDTLLRSMETAADEGHNDAAFYEVGERAGIPLAVFARLPLHHKQRILQEARRRCRPSHSLGKPFEPARSSNSRSSVRGTAAVEELRPLLQSAAAPRRKQSGTEVSTPTVSTSTRQSKGQHTANPTASRVEEYLLRAYADWRMDVERWAAPRVEAPGRGQTTSPKTPALNGSGLLIAFLVRAVEETFSLFRVTGEITALATEDLSVQHLEVLRDMQHTGSSSTGTLCFIPASLSTWLSTALMPGQEIYLGNPFFLFPHLGAIVSSYNVTVRSILEEDAKVAQRRQEATDSLSVCVDAAARCSSTATDDTNTALDSPARTHRQTSGMRQGEMENALTPTPFRTGFYDPLRDAAPAPGGGELPEMAERDPVESSHWEEALFTRDPVGAGFFRGPSLEWNVPLEILEELQARIR